MLPAILIALSTLVSEDLACISAGLLISQGQLPWTSGLLGCTLGIFIGDLLLVVAGRHARRFRIQAPALLGFLERQPGRTLVWTRFTPGLRLPTYLGAGLLRLPMRTVVPPLAAGSVLWTPLLVGLAAWFGAAFVRSTLQALQAVVVAGVVWRVLSSADRRRRTLAFFVRLIRWEFWPAWAAYLPVIPYLLYLGIKHRSLTLFTAANPGIPTGGLVGESKSAILGGLASEADFVARFVTVPPGLPLSERIALVRRFLAGEQLSFPVVLKPDIGERGSGVAIVRSEDDLRKYLGAAQGLVIAQEYIGGEEFGVFYCRRPGEATGRVTSITAKHLPSVTGDGSSTLESLILRDRRAFLLARAYRAGLKRPVSDIPARGEVVPLVEVGSHCRGAIFLDATHCTTPSLESAIDRISQAHSGFYFGRYDVRAESLDAFAQGRFKVLELNGVAGEATHVYDPAVSLWAAYRTIFQQWRTAYEIGAANRENGAAPASLGEIFRAWRAAQARFKTGH